MSNSRSKPRMKRKKSRCSDAGPGVRTWARAGGRSTGSRADDQTRIMVAQAAARFMYEQGIREYDQARHKAAQALGVAGRSLLPTHGQIQDALAAHQRLFDAGASGPRYAQMLAVAIEAMEFFITFEPRLVGEVLQGIVSPHSQLELHLFCDVPERVATRLLDHDIPFDDGQRRVLLDQTRAIHVPSFGFSVGGVVLEVLVFSYDGLRAAPRCPVHGRALVRASLSKVQELALGQGGARAQMARNSRT